MKHTGASTQEAYEADSFSNFNHGLHAHAKPSKSDVEIFCYSM